MRSLRGGEISLVVQDALSSLNPAHAVGSQGCRGTPEEGPVADIFGGPAGPPARPYTGAVLGSVPSRAARGQRLVAIPGQIPHPDSLPQGCAFERGPGSRQECPLTHPLLPLARLGMLVLLNRATSVTPQLADRRSGTTGPKRQR